MAENWLLSWLTGLNLTEYHETFTHSGYVSPGLMGSIMDRDQLKAIGVVKMGHISRLLRAIEKLRNDEGEMSSPSLTPEKLRIIS